MHEPLLIATGTRLGTTRIGGLLLAMLFLTGCQSGGQQDLVVREMRQQEDQIFAMQNYLEDYQKLLCQYRADNAALKRQLAEGRSSEPRSKDDNSNSPKELEPRKRRTSPPKESDQDSNSEPDRGPNMELPPAPEITDPEVPPLDATKSSQADLNWGQEEEIQNTSRDSQVLTAAAIEQVESEVEVAAPEPLVERIALIEITKGEDAQFASRSVRSAELILVQGEVVPNDSGGGPRIFVEVKALESAIGPGPFVGRAELMVLNPADGSPQPVARWNFAADAVQAAMSDADGRTMQFRLELPPESAVDTPVELWVRLLPAEGGKMLTHVPLDLLQAGQFTSTQGNSKVVQDSKPTQLLVSSSHIAHGDPVRRNLYTATSIDGDGWTTALPGEPSDAHCLSESQWRASSEPIPAMVQAFVPASPVVPPAPTIIQAAALEAPTAVPQETGKEKATASPEFDDAVKSATPTAAKEMVRAAVRSKPAWSPTR